MAVKVKFFIKTIKQGKNRINNEEVNIRIRFSNGRSFDLTALSGKQINPDFWNNEKGVVRQRAAFTNSDDFQDSLDKLKNHLLKQFDDTPNKSIIDSSWLTQAIDKFHNPEKYVQSNETLFTFIQRFIDNADKRLNKKTGNPVCNQMKSEYQATFDYLKKYAAIYGEIDFNDIDLDFYQKYLEVLRKESLKPNTIGKKVDTLKTFLNAATKLGINHSLKYKDESFKTITEEVDNIYLTKTELDQIYSLDLNHNPSLERVRDVFLVGCWTALRYSDLHQMRLDRALEGIINITQQKTGDKALIPIHPLVNKILKKYDGKLPEKISNQKYNDYIKVVGKLAKINTIIIKSEYEEGKLVSKEYKKHQLITSHTARRSFCTNAYLDGIPVLAIMAVSGHRTERAFLKYIKITKQEQAKKVFDFWNEQNNATKVIELPSDDYSI
jgi:site-specific recombinase XerD